MTKEEEAKQLDSVTDVVQEKELDASKAQQAMSALATTKQTSSDTAAAQAIAVSPKDVAFIVEELEVTEDVAARALREVEGASLVAALKKLVTTG